MLRLHPFPMMHVASKAGVIRRQRLSCAKNKLLLNYQFKKGVVVMKDIKETISILIVFVLVVIILRVII